MVSVQHVLHTLFLDFNVVDTTPKTQKKNIAIKSVRTRAIMVDHFQEVGDNSVEDETCVSERVDSIAVHKQRMQRKSQQKQDALNEAHERAQIVQDKVANYTEDNLSFTSDVSTTEISPLGSLVQASGDSVILARKRLGLEQDDKKQQKGQSRFANNNNRRSSSEDSGDQPPQQPGMLNKIASISKSVRQSISQSFRGNRRASQEQSPSS
eukprot:TRINITY_DN51328_c0_g1_i1.p1 TRINITY_DN51328_c0_g1~~TRINITY_DN51328_c0_g1_i1.p1  ORF type:complete len:210 (+),score=21.76 TRINITY_DN51328_c0_g1_i1:40-669(+)